MTAQELAQILHARKVGKRRWIAKCVAHPDRHPSLSIAEGKKGVLLKCQSNGCDTKTILDALGLRWADLFYGSDVTLEIKQRLAEEKRLAGLDRRFALVLWLVATDRPRRKYWHAAAVRIGTERRELREKSDPDLKRDREFQEKVRRVGWDAVWREFLASELGGAIARQHGRHDDGTGESPEGGTRVGKADEVPGSVCG